MGNCLRRLSTDDVSLLHGSEIIENSEFISPNFLPYTSPHVQMIQNSLPPNVSRSAAQLTEEEQVKIAKRIGLIHHLPCGVYDGNKKARECVICMGDFMIGDNMRYLPCVHMYHKRCIDDWLMRSFTCPSCMQPVDSVLLMTYQNNTPSLID